MATCFQIPSYVDVSSNRDSGTEVWTGAQPHRESKRQHDRPTSSLPVLSNFEMEEWRTGDETCVYFDCDCGCGGRCYGHVYIDAGFNQKQMNNCVRTFGWTFYEYMCMRNFF